MSYTALVKRIRIILHLQATIMVQLCKMLASAATECCDKYKALLGGLIILFQGSQYLHVRVTISQKQLVRIS